MSDVHQPPVANSVIEPSTATTSIRPHLDRSQQRRLLGLIGSIAAVTLLFLEPLTTILSIALGNDLHSYIPLVPVISGYLLYTRPAREVTYRSSIGAALGVAAIGMTALAAASGLGGLSDNDKLSLMTLAYVSFVASTGFVFLGSDWMRTAAFPVAFLIFMVPLPDAVVTRLELALVAASADVSALFFKWTGTPIFRVANTLTLPGIVLEVAQECSGIRSTVVLFITSVLTSHLFLQGTWSRIMLVAFVIPLAIVRNAFRILVIGLLCVHIGPDMIDSVIHRQGGPIFFALSMIPMLLFLVWLRRHDSRGHAGQ